LDNLHSDLKAGPYAASIASSPAHGDLADAALTFRCSNRSNQAKCADFQHKQPPPQCRLTRSSDRRCIRPRRARIDLPALIACKGQRVCYLSTSRQDFFKVVADPRFLQSRTIHCLIGQWHADQKRHMVSGMKCFGRANRHFVSAPVCILFI